jgi:hypothetical protein
MNAKLECMWQEAIQLQCDIHSNGSFYIYHRDERDTEHRLEQYNLEMGPIRKIHVQIGFQNRLKEVQMQLL